MHRGEKGKEAGICAALLRVRENTHSLRQPGRHPGGGDNPEGSGDTPQVTQLGGAEEPEPRSALATAAGPQTPWLWLPEPWPVPTDPRCKRRTHTRLQKLV